MADNWSRTIHLAYLDGELTTAAIVDGVVLDVARDTIARHHPDARLVQREWPVGESGWLVRLVYEAETHHGGRTQHWRHEFRRPDDAWSTEGSTPTTEGNPS